MSIYMHIHLYVHVDLYIHIVLYVHYLMYTSTESGFVGALSFSRCLHDRRAGGGVGS